MAYPVSKSGQTFTASSSITVDLSAVPHVANDLLLVTLSQDGGGTTIAPDATSVTAGWAMIGTQGASGNSRQAKAYLVAAGSSTVNPVFTGAGEEWVVTVEVIRDADPTTPIHGSARGDYNTVSSASAPALTTTNNDCLLNYSACTDAPNAFRALRFLSEDVVCVDKQQLIQVCHVVGYRQQHTAGAVPTPTLYLSDALEGGNIWVVAINNKSGGSKAPDCRAGFTVDNWFGLMGSTHQAVTWAAPNGIAAAIDGVTVSSTSPTTAITAQSDLSPWGTFTTLTSTESTAGAWVGGSYTHSSTDLTGKIFSVEWQVGNVSAVRAGAKGYAVVFGDSGGNWVAYQLSIKDGIIVGQLYVNQIALGVGEELDSSGTMDWSDVTKRAYITHRIGSSATSESWFIKNAVLSGTAVMTGGGASSPCKPSFLDSALNGWGYNRLCDLQGSGMMLAKFPVQAGDGSTPTYYDSTAQAFEYPGAYTSTGLQRFWNVPSGQVGFSVNASASDTINVVAGVMATALSQSWSINSSSSTSATYSFNGQPIVGFNVTWKTGVPCDGPTFKDCGEIDAKGATFANVTIADTSSTDAAIAFSETGGELDSCTIDVTGTSAAYHLELGTACESITLTDVTFTGTPGTDKVHVRKTTGTVTISLSGATTLAAGDVTSEGATVSIVSDPVYQSVVVSGFTSGSRIQIYDTTNNTELFNGTASSGNTVVSGTTATWTDPVAAAGNRAIRVRISYVSGATAKVFQELTGLTAGTTSGTASVTYPVTQVADTTYDNNAIDGSTVTGVTFTDSSPDVVNIDVASNAITWPSIYAAWVYYAFTSTGIATDIDYIDGVDEANYILSNMKIKNTSSPSEPLEVTGGYGRDATTGAAIDLVDSTGGTLIFAPDHVVSYAVGSGVTSQDKTDIATAVLTAAASAPIQADIRKVIGDTLIQGSTATPSIGI